MNGTNLICYRSYRKKPTRQSVQLKMEPRSETFFGMIRRGLRQQNQGPLRKYVFFVCTYLYLYGQTRWFVSDGLATAHWLFKPTKEWVGGIDTWKKGVVARR